MKKTIVIVVLVVLAAGGGWWAYAKWVRNGRDPQPQAATAKVERGLIRLAVASTGRVVSNLDVDIKCKASGEIVKLPYDVSDPVKKDALLLELDPVDQQRVLKQTEVELSASQAKLQIARGNLKIAESTLATDRRRAETALTSVDVRAKDARNKADRMKQLLDKQLSSKEEYETAETAAVQASADLDNAKVKLDELKTQEEALELRRQEVKLAEAQVEADKIAQSVAQDRLADTKVVSPMEAVVSARNVQIGQIISSAVSNVGGGTTVLTLSDLSHVFVVASVDESDIGRVKLDQPAAVTADAYRGRSFQGQVVRIATKGVNLSNVVTFEVKIEITGENKALLKPEMTANVEIVAAEKKDVLTVPVEALTRKGGKQFATVVAADQTTQERTVQIGISDGTRTEIASGLAEGDTVILRKGAADSRWNAGQRPPGPGGGIFPGGGRGGR